MEPDPAVLAVMAACLVGWGLLSRRLERLNLTAPIFFVAAGLVLANGPLKVVDVHLGSAAIRLLAELTLALLLFSGAAGVDVHRLRRDVGLPARLLGLGLPLTIGLGFVLARLVLPGLSAAEAALLAAAVAPTDAALGEAITSDPAVPRRMRRTLGVESGLNDGIATPFVMFFLTLAVSQEAPGKDAGEHGAVGQLLVGVLIGVVLGAVVGRVLAVARRHGWAGPAAQGLVVLGLALACYASSLVLDGNGFIAAFVGGLAFGAVFAGEKRAEAVEFDTETGDLLSALVWFGFGAGVLPLLGALTWQVVLFAVLTLTVVRVLPVGLVLVGSGLSRRSVLFIGWFGPRGLASVVFGLLAVDALASPGRELLGAAVACTVIASVVAHGVTARPGIGWLGRG
jgi:NhaP-type Na+/H+ or K+/H+ antiporter